MALTYGFYNSVKGDRKYDAMQFSELIDTLIIDGIIPSKGQLFAVTTAENGMQINVGTGMAWFFHSWTKNDSVMVLTVSESDITRPRIDAVVLEVDRTDPVRANSIKIIKGEPNVNAEKPTLVMTDKVHQYPLAYITVSPAAEEIKAENIESMIGRTPTVFATGVLETVPLDELWNQWEGEWDTWFAAIKLQLSGDVVTNLQLQIEDRVKIADKATDADVEAGTSDSKWMTPAKTKQMIARNEEYTFEGGVKGKIVENKEILAPIWFTASNNILTSETNAGSCDINLNKVNVCIDFEDYILFINAQYKLSYVLENKIIVTSINATEIVRPTLESNKVYILYISSSSVSISEIVPNKQNPINAYKQIHIFNNTNAGHLLVPEISNSNYIGLVYSSGSYNSIIKVYNKTTNVENTWSVSIGGSVFSLFDGYISGNNAVIFSYVSGTSSNYYTLKASTIRLLDGAILSDTQFAKDAIPYGYSTDGFLIRFDNALRFILCYYPSSTTAGGTNIKLYETIDSYTQLNSCYVPSNNTAKQYNIYSFSERNIKLISSFTNSIYGFVIVKNNSIQYIDPKIGSCFYPGMLGNYVISANTKLSSFATLARYGGPIVAFDVETGKTKVFQGITGQAYPVAYGKKYALFIDSSVLSGGTSTQLSIGYFLFTTDSFSIYAKEIK